MELILIPLITGIMEAFKMTKKLPQEYAALTSLCLGLGFGLAYWQTADGALYGLICGLAASGLYDVAKNPVKTLMKK